MSLALAVRDAPRGGGLQQVSNAPTLVCTNAARYPGGPGSGVPVPESVHGQARFDGKPAGEGCVVADGRPGRQVLPLVAAGPGLRQRRAARPALRPVPGLVA